MNPLQGAIAGGGQQMMGAPIESPEGAIMPSEAPMGNQNAAYVAPTISMPDTLAASLQNVNKHLILIARGQAKFDFESTAPQIESMMSLLEAVQEGDEEDAEPNT
jgi:hypothetical protein